MFCFFLSHSAEVTISAILTGKYHEVLGVSQNMMAPHVFDVWDNVTSVEECAALVDLRDKPIRADIGSFNQSSNQCAFGVILVGSAYTTLVPVPEYQFVDVYLRIGT